MRSTRQSHNSHNSWAERAVSLGGEIHDDADGATYRVVRFLGRGGMGEVYEVVRVDTGARYALKCLQLEHVRNAKTIERTRREALTLRDIRHPNVVRVHTTGVREDGLIWMVMDLLTGHTWAQVHQRLARLPLPWALRLGRAVTDGLQAVHAHAVHRDIKPENLHFGDDAVVRVLDLGAGKFHHSGLLTTGGGTLGTVPYMAPEQMTSEITIDARCDIFSLGLVLMELVSGVHPLAPRGLDTENIFTFVRKIVAGPPLSAREIAPWVPGHVAAVLDKAVVRDRALRYQSAADFGAALTTALQRLEREVGVGEPLGTLVAELGRLGGRTVVAANPFAATAVASFAVDDETPLVAATVELAETPLAPAVESDETPLAPAAVEDDETLVMARG
jgi:serine/threonine protein kinase